MQKGSQLTVLCFDQDRSMLLALERFLRWEQYRVIYTNDPAKAMNLIRKGGIDVLLCENENGTGAQATFFKEMDDLGPDLVRLSFRKPWNPVDLRRSLKEIIAGLPSIGLPLSA